MSSRAAKDNRPLAKSIFGSKDAKKDQKNKSKEDVKAPKQKYNTLDDAFPSFVGFLENPMALSYFRSYLHAKVCVENLMFYERVVRFRSIESKQSANDNYQFSQKIYQDFFLPGDNSYVLNIDSALMREVTESVSNLSKPSTATTYKKVVDLVIHQMQTEWFYFKKAKQGNVLLDNLNNNTYIVLPDPGTRAPISLPDHFTDADNPVNWGLGSSGPSSSSFLGSSSSSPSPLSLVNA